MLWATILLVSIPTTITFLNCCSLEAWCQSAWVLQPARISVLNWRQILFKLLIFVPFVKTPKLLKNFHDDSNAVVGFCTGCPSIILHLWEVSYLLWDLKLCGLFMLCNLICRSSKVDLLLQSWLIRLSLWITEISWEANGRVCFLNDLVPVSNWADCAQNLQAAFESAQRLPQWEWRLWVVSPLWPCNSWPLLAFGSLLM